MEKLPLPSGAWTVAVSEALTCRCLELGAGACGFIRWDGEAVVWPPGAKAPRRGREGQTWPWSAGGLCNCSYPPSCWRGHPLSALLLWGWKGFKLHRRNTCLDAVAVPEVRGLCKRQRTGFLALAVVVLLYCCGFFLSSWNKDEGSKPRRISSPLSSVGKLPLCEWIGFIWMLPISPARAQCSWTSLFVLHMFFSGRPTPFQSRAEMGT